MTDTRTATDTSTPDATTAPMHRSRWWDVAAVIAIAAASIIVMGGMALSAQREASITPLTTADATITAPLRESTHQLCANDDCVRISIAPHPQRGGVATPHHRYVIPGGDLYTYGLNTPEWAELGTHDTYWRLEPLPDHTSPAALNSVLNAIIDGHLSFAR